MTSCGHFDPPQPRQVVDPPVVIHESAPTLEVPRRRAKAELPKWESEARERLRAGIRKFSKPLQDLANRDANEGDTRMVVNRILVDALGYDEFSDLTTEYQVRGEFADYGVRIDGELIAFIEVKRVKSKLQARQLRQVEMYAVNEGVSWAVLTNGAEWHVYHLGDRTPIEIDLALQVDLLGDATPAQKLSELFYLTRESLKRRQMDELWQAKRATSPKSLASVLMTDPVAEAIRKEVRRATGQRVESSEITRLLRETVIRPECLG